MANIVPKALSRFKPRTSESRRIPLEREISFRVPRFENFVTEYSANISATGIFIRTSEPLSPGTELSLEFKVADDWKLIRGRGRVIWVRNRDEGAEKPAGMGIRFLEMDPQSRRLIHWMVDKHAREGGETFELEQLRQTADEALGEVLADERDAAGAETFAASGVRSGRGRAVFLVLAGAGIAAALVWLLVRPTPADTAGTVVTADPQPAISQPVTDDDDTPEPAPGASTRSEEVIARVRDWATAWSEGRVDDYLAFYSSGFVPADGLSRSQWQAYRAERLTTPRYIRVSITAVEVEVLAPDRVRSSFFQNYRSERFEDTVRKELEMALEDGSWRIVSERVAG